MKTIHIIVVILYFIFATGCAMPVSYYTNPNSAGYNSQGLGAICEHCGRQYMISGNQLNNREYVTCCYCGRQSNTKQAALRWVQLKPQYDQQATQSLLLTAIQVTDNTLNKTYHPAPVYAPPPVNVYTPPSSNLDSSNMCSSDFECGIGKKCIKASLQFKGVCMVPVDELGFKTNNTLNTDNVGINTDLKGKCDGDYNCPIGFTCDKTYKVCVK